MPIGGVGGATLGASLWPHSWQKTSRSGLSQPQVPQITRPDGTSARGRPSSSASVRVPDLELDVEPEELGDARGPGVVRGIDERAKVDDAVVQRQTDDGAPRDLGLEAERDAAVGAEGVDGPLVSVSGDSRRAAQVRRQDVAIQKVVPRLATELLQDGELVERVAVLLRELVGAPHVPGSRGAPTDAGEYDAASGSQGAGNAGGRGAHGPGGGDDLGRERDAVLDEGVAGGRRDRRLSRQDRVVGLDRDRLRPNGPRPRGTNSERRSGEDRRDASLRMAHLQ